jgi:dTDP-4-dehydrorhamnose 3,5-epimerase
MDSLNEIKGVNLTPLKKIEHPKGDVFHGMKKSDDGFSGFQEAYFSTIHQGVVKPWKKHLEMTLNLIVPIGKIRFVLFDDREESITKGVFMDISLSIDNYYRLTIPPNIWVASKGLGNDINLLLNIANLEHDPKEMVKTGINRFNYNWE